MTTPTERKCAGCIFCKAGRVRTDYNRKTGKHDEREAILCTLHPPAPRFGFPETSETLVCSYYTDADGLQPLRHLGNREAN